VLQDLSELQPLFDEVRDLLARESTCVEVCSDVIAPVSSRAPQCFSSITRSVRPLVCSGTFMGKWRTSSGSSGRLAAPTPSGM
jgi:hypothetical protein